MLVSITQSHVELENRGSSSRPLLNSFMPPWEEIVSLAGQLPRTTVATLGQWFSTYSPPSVLRGCLQFHPCGPAAVTWAMAPCRLAAG